MPSPFNHRARSDLRAFAEAANKIKHQVHERLHGEDAAEALRGRDGDPGEAKPFMADWIGKWYPADHHMLFICWADGWFLLMCLIVKVDETIWAVLRALN